MQPALRQPLTAFAAFAALLGCADQPGRAAGDAAGDLVLKDGLTAQQQIEAEFAAHALPTLPDWPEGATVAPGDFRGATVTRASDARNLAEVTADLRRGVDADIGFSYAICALAGWAETQGVAYARPVLRRHQPRAGSLRVNATFMLSQKRPSGLRVVETNDTLRECAARGIPAA